jgi:hypothetical protein
MLLALSAIAAADSRVRVSVQPAKGARVGEPVTFTVELMTTRWFSAGPRLPELDVAGAVVRRLSSFGINGTADIGDTQYTTQAWEYTIYPQRAGAFEIPALRVRMFPAGRQPVDATTEPARFEVEALPGGAALSAAAFTADQSYARGDELRVGDALTRTVTLSAEGTPAMLLPPLGAPEAEGMTAYPKGPSVTDTINRGAIRGVRVEETSYVFERPGAYRFPEIRISWWNSRTKAIETVTLAGFDVEVAPNPDLAPAADAPPAAVEETGFAWWIVVAPALLFALLLSLRGPVLRFRERWAMSESASFQALRRARDPHATYLALGAWLARAGLEPDAALRAEVDALGDHCYGRGGSWDRAALLRAAAAVRERARRGIRAARAALPPLNPR